MNENHKKSAQISVFHPRKSARTLIFFISRRCSQIKNPRSTMFGYCDLYLDIIRLVGSSIWNLEFGLLWFLKSSIQSLPLSKSQSLTVPRSKCAPSPTRIAPSRPPVTELVEVHLLSNYPILLNFPIGANTDGFWIEKHPLGLPVFKVNACVPPGISIWI